MMKRQFNIHLLRSGRTLSIITLLFLAVIMSYTSVQANDKESSATCQPTPPDALGPFYKPDAPIRSKVGEGYILQGVVRSAKDCQPLPGATIEFWMADPDRQYRDEYRARLIADKKGHYKFESHIPVPYAGRPPHIHIRVTAVNHQVLVTQHYPKKDQKTATFNLVLRPGQQSSKESEN